jgi:hypothetical protein
MEAGPRDNEETAVDDVERVGSAGPVEDRTDRDGRSEDGPLGNGGSAFDSEAESGAEGDPDHDQTLARDEALARDETLGRDESDDSPSVDGTPVEPHDLRPQRKLRVWQIAPIVVLSAIGSLMFAFPLAFEPGGSTGAVVSMLGLLICGCAAGWGVMAARRAGLTWPGLPARGSDDRPDWRVVLLYAVIVGTVVVLAIWRVARLR